MKQVFALTVAALALVLGGVPAQANRPKSAPVPMTLGLPIAEGVWVDTKSKCGSAEQAWLYSGFTFGSAFRNAYVGSNFDPIENLVRSTDGFIRINGGPREIKPLADGRMVFRTYSASEGELDRSILRKCELASLAPAMRADIERGLASPPSHAIYVAGRASGSWSLVAYGSAKAAQYSGDGHIETLALSCSDGKDAGPDKVTVSLRLRGAAPISATRLGLAYPDGGSMATTTAMYLLPDENRWVGPADDGIADTLDISSRIIIDMGTVGAEDIPLNGSSAAIREALASCWRSRR